MKILVWDLQISPKRICPMTPPLYCAHALYLVSRHKAYFFLMSNMDHPCGCLGPLERITSDNLGFLSSGTESVASFIPAVWNQVAMLYEAHIAIVEKPPREELSRCWERFQIYGLNQSIPSTLKSFQPPHLTH